MSGPQPHVELEVHEAPEADVGLGRARLDGNARDLLGAEVGDVVEIVGKKRSAAQLFPLMQEDEGQRIIRVDEIVRKNLGVNLGENVEVRKVEAIPAERVTLRPILGEGHMISFGQGIEDFVKQGLLKRPVMMGDVVIVPGIALMGGVIKFMIVEAVPGGVPQVVSDSIVEVGDEPIRSTDIPPSDIPLMGLSPEEIYPHLVRALKKSTDLIFEVFDASLDTLPNETREKAARLAERLRKLLEDASTDR